jgi:hypothetical protein
VPIIVMDPTTQSDAATPRYAPKLPSLEGRRVGILDNGKANADRLLDEVESILRARHGVLAFVRRQKLHFSRPAPPELLAELRSCDAVVTGVGD